MKIKKKWLYLPVEIKARELDAKVLLGCFAALEGWGVILGRNMFVLDKDDLPQGLFLDKSISPNKNDEIEKIVNRGHQFASLDEEGLVYKSDDEYCRQRLSVENFKKSKLIFSWGNEQSKLIKSFFKEDLNKIISTGSPRVDLMRTEYRKFYSKSVENIRSKFGEYVFIPSNFSAPNHACGPDFILNQFKQCGYVQNQKEINFLKLRIEYQKKIFLHFLEMIPFLSANFPEVNFVVRPHPGDKQEVWHKAVQGLPNFFCEWDGGSSIPWILGSKAVIHNSCTSAVEAKLLEIPTISYMPEYDSRFEQNIPNDMGLKALSLKELSDELILLLSNSSHLFNHDSDKIIQKHIDSIDGNFAYEKILIEINKLSIKSLDYTINSSFYRIKNLQLYLKKIFKKFVKKDDYNRQKFPGISCSEISKIIKNLQLINKKVNNVNCMKVSENMIMLYT